MWILRRTHIEALLRRAEIHIVKTIVIADGWGPRTTGIMLVAVPPRLIEATVDLTDVTPVHHILRLQHLHAEEVEIRRHHIESVSDADNVRIGEIRIQHGIAVGAVALIAPALSVRPHNVRPHIGRNRLYVYIRELYVARMTHIKALRRQVAPHGRLRIGLLLLVPDGVVDGSQICSRYPTLVMQCDIREPDILYRMTGQTCDGTAHSARIADMDIAEMHAIDTAHMVDGNQFGDCVLIAVTAQSCARVSQLVAPAAIAQTDENGRFRALDGEVRHVHILQHTAIDDLQ